jgi:hypothetical protein
MPIILTSQEAEIRSITVPSQARQISLWDPRKYPSQKQNWWSGSRCRPWVQTLAPYTHTHTSSGKTFLGSRRSGSKSEFRCWLAVWHWGLIWTSVSLFAQWVVSNWILWRTSSSDVPGFSDVVQLASNAVILQVWAKNSLEVPENFFKGQWGLSSESTYLQEARFSSYTSTQSVSPNSLNAEAAVRLQLSSIKPDVKM